MSSQYCVSIPRLANDGSNWVTYHEQMEDILYGSDYYENIQVAGSAAPPKELSDDEKKI
jgi:hypothetical protein